MELTKERTIWDSYCPLITEGATTTAYITEMIGEASYYNELIHKLYNAQDHEKFNLIINTPGGVVDAGLAIRNAIMASKAFVTAKITGSVASAGTMITLACDDLDIEPNVSFMCHEISMSGVSGKFSDIHTMQEFYKAHFAQMSKDIYKDFLSEEELTQMHSGKELWLNGEDVQQRWLEMHTPSEEAETE